MIRRSTWIILGISILLITILFFWQRTQENQQAQTTPTSTNSFLFDLGGRSIFERGSLHGGYITATCRCETPCHGELWPYARWHYYEGGCKSAPNSPSTYVDEWSLGLEWQIRKEFELTCEYLMTDRTNLRPFPNGLSYEQFAGGVLRLQFQVNF